MKLLVCDDKKITQYFLPKKIDKSYMLELELYSNNNNYHQTINFKSNNNTWYVNSNENMLLKLNGAGIEKVPLQENMFFEVKYSDMNEYVKIYVMSDFEKLDTYSLNGIGRLTIGSKSDSTIQLDYLMNESVVLEKDGYDYFITRIDNNKSSSYVNLKTFKKRKLKMGDTIFVGGIKIIYMCDVIKINRFSNIVNISGINKTPQVLDSASIVSTPLTATEKNVKLFEENEVFVHTPRLKSNIKEENINIEMPPSSSKTEKMPAIFTYGTSAIMGLTSVMSFTNNLRSFIAGQTDKVTFLIELIMEMLMIASSFMLPYMAQKWEERREKRAEKLRVQKYSEYLTEKDKLIDNIVLEQTRILKENNIPLENIEENIKNKSGDIWSREIIDEDFLSIVLGTGNIQPFININYSVEEFSLESDDLKNRAIEIAQKERKLENVPVTYSLVRNNIVPFAQMKR